MNKKIIAIMIFVLWISLSNSWAKVILDKPQSFNWYRGCVITATTELFVWFIDHGALGANASVEPSTFEWINTKNQLTDVYSVRFIGDYFAGTLNTQFNDYSVCICDKHTSCPSNNINQCICDKNGCEFCNPVPIFPEEGPGGYGIYKELCQPNWDYYVDMLITTLREIGLKVNEGTTDSWQISVVDELTIEDIKNAIDTGVPMLMSMDSTRSTPRFNPENDDDFNDHAVLIYGYDTYKTPSQGSQIDVNLILGWFREAAYDIRVLTLYQQDVNEMGVLIIPPNFPESRRIPRALATRIALENFDFTQDAKFNTNPPPDVDPATERHSGWIKTAYNNGVVGGYPDGYFRPNRLVNRVEFLKMVLLAAKIPIESESYTKEPVNKFGQPFPDLDKTQWYYPYVKAAYNLGIIVGTEEGFLMPGNHLSEKEGKLIVDRTKKALNQCISLPTEGTVNTLPKTEEEIAKCPVILKNKTFILNFPSYCQPVDIYIVISNPDGNLCFVNSNNNLTNDYLAYSIGGTSKINSSFSVNDSSLSSQLYGECSLYWLIAPSNGGDIEKAIRDRAYELGMYGFELPPKISSFTNSLGMTFNLIPTGTFTMGSPSDELGRRDDETQHQVTLTKSYYMQTTEVTQGQWKAVMGGNSSYFSNCGENCPVEQCSWDDIQIFITKLNAKREGSYSLPTEAQWEYAARAGTTGAYAGNLDNMGWYSDNSGNKTHSVAQKSPNAWGLYDMHGNVWELCEDWYGAYPSGSVTDPVGASSGSDHVLRGGSGFGSADSCRSGFRFNFTPNLRSYRIGFRLVYSASASPSLSIAISGEPQVDENSGSQYTCTATYSNGTKPVDITKSATWIDNSSYAGIDVSSGYLTTYSVDADQPCTITATYGGKSATYGVTIKDKPVLTVTGTWSYGYYDLSCDGLIEGTFSIYINSNGTFLRTHTSGGVAGTKDGGIWTLTGKQIILNAKGYDNEYGNKIDGYGSILTGTFNSTYTKIEKGTFTHAETPGGCWYAER